MWGSLQGVPLEEGSFAIFPYFTWNRPWMSTMRINQSHSKGFRAR